MTRLTGADFTEVADRVWVARYEWFDVNVTLVGGDRGLLVVDTHGSGGGRAARWSTTYAASAPARWSASSTPTGTSTTPSATATFRDGVRRRADPRPRDGRDELDRRGRDGSSSATPTTPTTRTATTCSPPRIVPADHTFSSAAVLDLGDRAVELVHPGRGHTAGDLVVRVPDADVLLAGDLVEESGAARLRRRLWPMDWPLSLDIVLGLTTPAHRRRPRPRRPGRPRLRRAPAQRDRHRRRDDPRPGHPRRTRRGGARRRRVALRRASSWRPPCAAATSSSPAARSGSPDLTGPDLTGGGTPSGG